MSDGQRRRFGQGFQTFRHRGFASYAGAHLSTNFAVQIQTVAVGWHVYDMTRDPLDLGLIGLSQFLPALLLVLVTGAVADRYSRRRIMGLCLLVMAAAAAGLVALTVGEATRVGYFLALLALFGTARAFFNPARQSIVPNLVPPSELAGAVAINSSAGQIASICGPVAGGLLYGLAPLAAYGTAIGLFGLAAVLVLTIPPQSRKGAKSPVDWQTVNAGFRYIWTNKVILGAISLDLFAVLLGGAMALLPVYARDVLDIGPTGLGLLRAAPAIGAIAVGLWLVTLPIHDHAGKIMFAAVASFGVFTVVFSVSTTLWISVVALALVGASDMVSVYIRGTLIQLWTPDDLRGRVNSVNQIFIGASNELGAFRAGAMAAITGPVLAVLLGGVGTVGVAAVWYRIFPQIRDIRALDLR